MPSVKLVGMEHHALVLGVSIYIIYQCSFPLNSVSASAKGSVGSSVLSACKEVQLYVVVAS